MAAKLSRRQRRSGWSSSGVEVLEQRQLLSAGALEVFSASAPAVFVENRGQWSDSQVRYGYQSQGAAVAFTDTGVLFQLSQGQGSSGESVRFAASFVGAGPTRPVGAQQADGLFSYYVGDVAQHRSNVPGFEQVLYSNLYSGVDLYTYGRAGQLKYEFHVAPGADYQQVQIRYRGIEGLSIAADGSLHIQTALGEMVDSAPVIYQEIAGQRREVAGEFVLLNEDTYAFEVTGSWDSRYGLVLDPELEWSTYVQGDWGIILGSLPESATQIDVDENGNVLVAGLTRTAGWVSGGYNTLLNEGEPVTPPRVDPFTDIYVVKLSPTGQHLWSTYLGGAGEESIADMGVDSSGHVYITGIGSIHTETLDTGDGFVAKLSPAGGLDWTTSLGMPASGEPANAYCAPLLAVADSGDVVIVKDYYDSSQMLYMIGVAVFSPSGARRWMRSVDPNSSQTSFGWSTDVAIDSGGNILLVGVVSVPRYSRLWDGLVLKLSPSGDLLWSRYLGGSGDDGAKSVAVDSCDNVVVAGRTFSAGWVTGGFETTYPDPPPGPFEDPGASYVAKFSTLGEPLWSTYLGSNGTEIRAVAVDDLDNILVAGSTWGDWISGGFDTSINGHVDAFVAKLLPSSAPLWSSYLGGSGYDFSEDIAVTDSGDVLVAGTTLSAGWVSGGYNTTYDPSIFAGDEWGDAFVAKVIPGIVLSPATIAENQPAGTLVGTLSPRHPGSGSWSYALVSGAGAEDNALFSLIGDQLYAAVSFDRESRMYYCIRVRASGPGGEVYEEALTIRITNVNEAPTALMLQGNTVAENQPVGTGVGILRGSDPDAREQFSYSLVSGSGAADNGRFRIVGDQLQTAAALDYEAQDSYTIRVRVTDHGGLWFEQNLTIQATDVNEAPSSISLSATGVRELQPAGTVVGTLSTDDPDAGESLTFELVDGSGAEDNASFAVVGNALQTAASFDYAAQRSYAIRLRASDAGGLEVERSFTIRILPVLPEVSVVGVPRVSWQNLNQRYYDLTLQWRSFVAPLDLASIDGDELRVTGPAGTLPLTLVSVSAAANGMSAEATYRLVAPGGRWDAGENGSYGLEVLAGTVADAQGNCPRAEPLPELAVSLPGAGALDVVVPGTANADVLSVTLNGGNYVVSINGMGYSYAGSNVRSIRIVGYGGNDSISINGESYICEVLAGTGNDTIQGGSGDDLIRGDEDNDVITGNGGDDTLYGNFGNDSITGDEGADSLMGGLGADTLEGGLMGDFIYGGDQMDWIEGEEGDDYIEGRGKADTIYGGSGNDTIYGGAGSDWISAQEGDDWIWVGLHLLFADSVDGGAGNDVSDGDSNDVLVSVENILA